MILLQNHRLLYKWKKFVCAAIDGRPLPEEGEHLTNEELQFIAITKDNTIRLNLLERLQELGELAAFLEAENETI